MQPPLELMNYDYAVVITTASGEMDNYYVKAENGDDAVAKVLRFRQTQLAQGFSRMNLRKIEAFWLFYKVHNDEVPDQNRTGTDDV